MTSAIQFDRVSKSFATRTGTVAAAVEVDLCIDPGEVVAFLGPNGAGKSTCIDMMLGLTDPTSGSARILGQPPRRAVVEGRIGAMLQSGGLLEDLSVRRTLQMVGSLHHRPIDVDALLERTGLAGLAERRISRCSGGERQRVRFALALMPEPEVLVLDEPTAGMDVSARAEFWDATRTAVAHGRTVVFATHYLKEAQDFADRIILIAAGRIIADGSVEEIRRRGSSRSVTASWPEWHPDLHIPDVIRAEASQDRVRLWTEDSDALARYLLNHTTAVDLEIASADLDEAFVHLTRTEEMA